MGVNKYNLYMYAKTFEFLHNRELDERTKFMKILSVVYLATTFYSMSESIYETNLKNKNYSILL